MPRPNLQAADIGALVEAAAAHPDGAILAARCATRSKRADAEAASWRDQGEALWRADPQAFRRDVLLRALQAARDVSIVATDEAMAVERPGAARAWSKAARTTSR